MSGERGLSFLVYCENGMKLAYSGDDPAGCTTVCTALERDAAGYVSGYQFVGPRRYEVRCYFDARPNDLFLALRTGRELFDFGWHPTPRSE